MKDLTRKLRALRSDEPPRDKEHDKRSILGLMRVIEANGRSTTAHDCKAAMGLEYSYAYRLLNQLVKEGTAWVSNDAYGRKRFNPV